MDGKEFRLKRFLSRSPKLVVAALDHGAFLGPLARFARSAGGLCKSCGTPTGF